MRSFFYPKHGCRNVPHDPGSRQKLDALRRVDRALQRAVDREAADRDLRVDVRVVAKNQLAPRSDLPLEPPIDAKRLFERQVSADVTPLVDEPVQSRSLPWLHRSSNSPVSSSPKACRTSP